MCDARANAGDASGLIVFDVDGTIADTVALHHGALLEAMRSFAIPRLDTDWGSYPNHTDAAIFEDAWFAGFGRTPTLAERGAFERRMNAAFDAASEPAPIREIAGAVRFIETARRAGWALAFATGGLRKLTLKKLAAIGLEFPEDVVVTSSEHPARNALVAGAVAAARAHYRTFPKKIVSFGDGRWDFETAQALGLAFVGVGAGPKADELRKRGAVVLQDFQDLPTAFAALSETGAPPP